MLKKYFVPLRIHLDLNLLESSSIKLEDLKNLSEDNIPLGLILDFNDIGRIDIYKKLSKKVTIGFQKKIKIGIDTYDIYFYPKNNNWKKSKNNNWELIDNNLNLTDLLEHKELIKIIPLPNHFSEIEMWENRSKNNFYWGLDIDFQNKDSGLYQKILSPMVAFPKVNFIDEYEALDMLVCINNSEKFYNKNRISVSKESKWRGLENWIEIYKSYPELILNTAAIFARTCNYIPKSKYNLNFYSNDQRSKFIRTCLLGLKFRKRIDKKHLLRLIYEIRIILGKNFANYFMVIKELIDYCYREDILIGPRGSAAGALVSYCLRITNLNPLDYNLMFERFLNPDRIDLPDYDLDFPSEDRIKVIQWLSKRFELTHKVMHIMTYNHWQVRNVIRAVGKSLGLSEFQIENIVRRIQIISTKKLILKDIIEENTEIQDLIAEDSKIESLFRLSPYLEGLITGIGIHAAGVVLVDLKLAKEIEHKVNPETNVMISKRNMHELEYMGLVKLDILGIDSLSVITTVLKEKGLSIESINLNDEKVFDFLKSFSTLGLFQLTYVNSEILKIIKVKNLSEIADVIGLNRPGSMEYIPQFIERKLNPCELWSLPGNCEKIASIVSSTANIFIWQEQIMEMVKKIANYNGAEADQLRKIIGKKMFEKMLLEKDKFIQQSALNVTREQAEDLWNIIEDFKGYGFNKSHGISYALNSYYTAYIKCYYPIEYFTAWCNYEKDNWKRSNFLQEASMYGFIIWPPNIIYSHNDKFIHDDKNIYCPLKLVLSSTSIHEFSKEKKFLIFEKQNTINNFDKKGNWLPKDIKENLKYFKFFWEDLQNSNILNDLIFNHHVFDDKICELKLRIIEIKNFRISLPRENNRIKPIKGSLILGLSDGSFSVRLTVQKPELIDLIKKMNPIFKEMFFRISWRRSVKDMVIENIF